MEGVVDPVAVTAGSRPRLGQLGGVCGGDGPPFAGDGFGVHPCGLCDTSASLADGGVNLDIS